MANTKSTQHEIDLTSELNLNKFKADIKPYAGFNERNSPYYGGALSPLFIKDKGSVNQYTKYYGGHKWETKNGHLYKDDVSVMDFDTQHFEKSRLSDNPNFKNKDILDFWDENNYVERINATTLKICYKGVSHQVTGIYSGSKYRRIGTDIEPDGSGNVRIIEKDFFVVATIASVSSQNEETSYTFYYNDANDNFDSFNLDYRFSERLLQGYLGLDKNYIQFGTHYYNKNTKSFVGIIFENKTNYNDGKYTYLEPSGLTWTINKFYDGARLVNRSVSTFYNRYYNSNLFGEMEVECAENYNYGGEITHETSFPIAVITDFGTYFVSITMSVTTHTTTYPSYETRGFVALSIYEDSLSTSTITVDDYVCSENTTSRTVPLHTEKISWTSNGEIYSNPGGYKKENFGTKNLAFCISVEGDIEMVCSKIINNANEEEAYFALGIHEDVNGIGKSYAIFESPTYKTDFVTSIVNPFVNVTLSDDSFVPFFSYDSKRGWRLLAENNGTATGISFFPKENLFAHELVEGTLLTSWGSVSRVRFNSYNKVTYYDTDLSDWVTISFVDGGNDLYFYNDYVVVNTTAYFNCYNINNGTKQHWASDISNSVNTTGASASESIYFSKYPLISDDYESHQIASGQNVNWLNDYLPSKKSGDITGYFKKGYIEESNNRDPVEYFQLTLRPATDDYNAIDVYFDKKYLFSALSIARYYVTFNSRVIYELSYYFNPISSLLATTYPGDAVRYNLPLLFNVIQGPLDATIVNFGSDVSFFTIYYDNKNRYQYYSSSITEFEQFFIIQGQAYGIARNKIYSLIYSGGAIQSSQPIVAIDGLAFVGNTIYSAYFYSETARAIYTFGADNNLTMLTQADSVSGITGSNYTISTGSLVLGTPEATYILNEKFGAYRLNDIKNFAYADQNESTVTLVTNDHAYEISYEEQNTEDGWVKQDIILDTSFYGAGSNVVSVNDCWYVRVTDPEHGTGEIKLAVSTLTDIGRQTETKTVKVKASDWDELTDTVYIRFQPKLQRAVGVSLHIESPFKVGYIGVGATPETLQLNKVNI
jgi:hypothetical protein